MGRIYQNLRDNGIVTLDVNLLKGDWSDQSVYNNPVSVVGTPTWTAGNQGWGLCFTGTQRLTVPDFASGRTNSGWVLIYCQSFPAIYPNAFFDKNTEFYAYTYDATRVAYGIGSASLITIPRKQPFLIGIELVQTGNSRLFINNSFVTGTAEYPVWSTASWSFFNLTSGTASLKTPAYRAMILDNVKDNDLINLCAEILTERYPTRAYSYQKAPTLKLNPTHNAILASNLQDIKGRTATDMSTNNKPGTLVGGCFNQANGLYIPGGTSGYVNYGDITALNNATKATIYVVADPRNDGVSTFAPYVSRGDADTSRIGIYHGNTTTTVQFSASNGSNGYKQLAGLPNKINHLCLSYDGSRVGAGERVHTYVDGKKVNSTLMAEFPASLPNLTADLRLGQFTYATSLESRNKYKFVGVFAEALNEGQVREIYKQFSRVTSYFNLNNIPLEITTVPTTRREITRGLVVASGTAILTKFGLNTVGNTVVTDGTMEAVGTASWGAYNTSTLSKQTGFSGQCLRVVRSGSLGGATQVCLTPGKLYRIKGKARSGAGTDIPAVGDGNGLSNYWYGTNSTNWQDIDVVVLSTHATLYLAKITTGSDYVEFDEIEIKEISESLYYGINYTAGANPQLYWNDNNIGGTRKFSFYATKDNNTLPKFAIGVGSLIGNYSTANQNAYWIRLIGNVLYLSKTVAGAVSDLGSANLIGGELYDVHWIWEFDGNIKVWIKIKNSNNWSLAIAAVDTTITSVNYGLLYMRVPNTYILDEIITNEIILTPEEWGG